MHVKICGVTSPEVLAAAVDAGADWIGYNFFPRSPRFLSPAAAAALHAVRPAGPQRIGLFVEPSDEEVATVLASVPLDALQIYAPAGRAAELGTRFGLPIWHAVGVGSAEDLPDRTPGIERLLLEAKPPTGATRPGGNAQTFDWSVLRGWTAPLPWLLAGGLTPANVRAAIETSGASAVDVSSGVERAPGVKDPAMIRAFIAAARAATLEPAR